MMDIWDSYIYYAIVSLVLLCIGALKSWSSSPLMRSECSEVSFNCRGAAERKSRVYVSIFTVLGLVVYATFIAYLWIDSGVPPLRTMGETRLWYSFFLPLVGLCIYLKLHYRWILPYSTVMAMVFVIINLLHPELHSETLAPVLQSPWFVPHVIVYMFAYALFGAALLMVFMPSTEQRMDTCDNLVRVALAFFTAGMLMGALWAKDAWGQYWTWDPKETWAAVTWFVYLAYLHLRRLQNIPDKYPLAILVVAFVLLQITWWGVNYLPSAQGMSVHVYGS